MVKFVIMMQRSKDALGTPKMAQGGHHVRINIGIHHHGGQHGSSYMEQREHAAPVGNVSPVANNMPTASGATATGATTGATTTETSAGSGLTETSPPLVLPKLRLGCGLTEGLPKTKHKPNTNHA